MNTPQQQTFNISTEQHRTYLYLNGGSLKVEEPRLLTITMGPHGELHAIQTGTPGERVIIIPGWNAIKIQYQVEEFVPVPDAESHE